MSEMKRRKTQTLTNPLRILKLCPFGTRGDNRGSEMHDSAIASEITEGHCRTIFIVKIKYDGSKWQATPKIFYSKEEAEKECEALKQKYTFISKCRVLTSRREEKGG